MSEGFRVVSSNEDRPFKVIGILPNANDGLAQLAAIESEASKWQERENVTAPCQVKQRRLITQGSIGVPHFEISGNLPPDSKVSKDQMVDMLTRLGEAVASRLGVEKFCLTFAGVNSLYKVPE